MYSSVFFCIRLGRIRLLNSPRLQADFTYHAVQFIQATSGLKPNCCNLPFLSNIPKMIQSSRTLVYVKSVQVVPMSLFPVVASTDPTVLSNP